MAWLVQADTVSSRYWFKWNVSRHRWATDSRGISHGCCSCQRKTTTTTVHTGSVELGQQENRRESRAWYNDFCSHIQIVWAKFEHHWNMDPYCLVSLAQSYLLIPSFQLLVHMFWAVTQIQAWPFNSRVSVAHDRKRVWIINNKSVFPSLVWSFYTMDDSKK